MWGRAMGPLLLPLLLLLLPGSLGLQCLSCGEDGGRCRGAANVTCPTESEVCSEALAAVTWSHGQFWLGGRGCGRGQPGSLARALQLPGSVLVLFERRRNCPGDSCNGRLPLGHGPDLSPPANASARTPNGLRCYGCPEEGPCPPDTIVECYDNLRGCFHGNVTLRMGNLTWWREVRGCVPDGACTQERRGDDAASLSGSCCSGDLCNRHLANKTFFAPDLPRLELLPHGHAPTAPPDNATAAAGGHNVTGGGEGGEGADVAAGEANTAVPEHEMAAGGKRSAGGKTAQNGGDGDKMAAGDKMGDGDKMAAGDKMVTSHVAPGRPMGRKNGTKGPVGRGQALGGPGWLLPFLLLPLLR